MKIYNENPMRASMAFIVVLSLLVAGCGSDRAKVGKPLPLWHEGEMDIHFINTGRGECAYQIFPDGTTMLTDASGSLLEFGVKESDPLPPKPSADITAGKVIVDYINRYSPEVSKGHINYMLLTHYDSDHIGAYKENLPMHESGKFRLGSLEEIGTSLIIDKIMDRDYPDYDYPTKETLDNHKVHNYRAFIEWTVEANGTVAERWNAGSRHQVVPLHDTCCNVTVQNLSGNGCFWTGEGETSISTFPTREEFENTPKEDFPAENAFSCSYMMTFGDFDFFLGGDLQYNRKEEFSYMDVEAPVARVAHKVEVMKANHHGTNFTDGEELLSVLRPDVWVVCPWRDVQPRPATVDRVMAANPQCDIFCTNMPEKNVPMLGDRMKDIDAPHGHIVVRVASDGKSYMVYALEDTDQEYRVSSIHGPYRCVAE